MKIENSKMKIAHGVAGAMQRRRPRLRGTAASRRVFARDPVKFQFEVFNFHFLISLGVSASLR
ncbi:MAG: hypothetical protein ACREUU_05680 [Gammaproteobacteria bacterium]